MRKIEPAMINWIDERLKNNGIAQIALKEKHARRLLIEAAGACVGVKEQGGNNRGPIVELMQKTIGDANGEAWCLSFVQTIIAYCEVKLNIKSRLIPTEHCLTMWHNSPIECRVQFFPLPGAIPIWQHGNTTNGHTGILVEATQEWFRAIEGNTGGGIDLNGAIVREGDGVYLTKRSMKGTGNMKLRGFLKPF